MMKNYDQSVEIDQKTNWKNNVLLNLIKDQQPDIDHCFKCQKYIWIKE